MNQQKRRNNRPLAALAIAACVICSLAASAATVKVTRTIYVTQPQSNIRLDHAYSQSDGTFLLSGRDDQKRLWIMKLSGDSKPLWQYTVSDGWRDSRVDFLFGAADGAYWAVVSQRTRDINAELHEKPGDWATITTAATQYFVSRFTDNGRPEQLIPISAAGEQRFLSCAAQTAGGFVVAGAIAAPSEPTSPLVPWIEKLDSSGKRVWAHSFELDEGRTIEVRPNQAYCRRLLASPDGTITWVMSVLMQDRAHTVEESIHNMEKSTVSDSSTVIVQLDANGNELGRLRHPSSSDGYLLDADLSFTLVERSYPSGLPQIAQQMRQTPILGFAALLTAHNAFGTKITDYGESLKESKTQTYKGEALANSIKAVARTPAGGILIAGCIDDGGQNFVVYISPTGTVSQTLQVSPKTGAQQCSLFQFGGGPHSGEASLLVANELAGNRLLTLEYSD